ncbi:hypothetical protein N481_23215 [Pseudoalteromonas luteoviolacea S4047-1]|uniref:Uncharacterized protein n=1 Tax=Pseudoalteromonas luteoviolacea S4054 TaxID=1129367 RepID=A0A0F6AIN6_9GAMM|nr:hypothetical protein N479_25865 [Pseudoalteromonas luteoviolacea S4054]KZN68602.1 hypothetical protein N481_23215 [Pseudoalteromonas luteoviolacea S4047-1]
MWVVNVINKNSALVVDVIFYFILFFILFFLFFCVDNVFLFGRLGFKVLFVI